MIPAVIFIAYFCVYLHGHERHCLVSNSTEIILRAVFRWTVSESDVIVFQVADGNQRDSNLRAFHN